MILERAEEHKMQILGRIALVTVTILLISLLILIVIWPYLRGILLPTRLACGSDAVHCFDRVEITPGGTFSKTLYFNNQCAYARDYRVTFVPQGALWSCDGGGQSLYYETAWSQGADLRLEPGETESVTIDVIFPQPASNNCQGKTGHLVVRHYFLDLDQEQGTCECQLSPMTSLLRTAFSGSSDLVSCPCAEVEWSQFDFNHP
jgi:hypothetical protein